MKRGEKTKGQRTEIGFGGSVVFDNGQCVFSHVPIVATRRAARGLHWTRHGRAETVSHSDRCARGSGGVGTRARLEIFVVVAVEKITTEDSLLPTSTRNRNLMHYI